MKKAQIFVLLIIFILIIASQQASINTLNQQCLCDITNQCDSECCCDSTCNSDLVTKWQTYRLCLDDNFGIPFCSSLSQTDINVLDLHSGLRTIYSVIKRLFCITSVNFVTPQDWYKITAQQNDIDTQIAYQQTVQSQSIFNTDLLAQTQFAISGLPLKGSNGLCRASSQLTKNNQKSSSCRIYVASSADVLTSMLSIQTLQTSLGITLNQYTTQTISTGIITSQNLVTACPTTSCTNVVRQVRIFINLNDGSVVSSLSYVVVGPLTVDQTGYISIDYQYSFVSIDNGQYVFPYSSKIGYEIGSPINLLYQDSSNNYYKILNPFNLAFRKTDGTCRTSSSDQTANSFVDFKFGVNQIISCVGTTNLIYSNLRQVFTYVGKYGTSSTKLSEYINVTGPTNTVQSVQLLIYYINIGIPQHPQYEISKVQMRSLTSADGLSTLYIQFISVENTYNLYVPPAPTVDAYLPNDFLYPFFVA